MTDPGQNVFATASRNKDGNDHTHWSLVGEQGDAQQLNLFPSHVEPPAHDLQVARVLVNRVRLERTRQFGAAFLGWKL